MSRRESNVPSLSARRLQIIASAGSQSSHTHNISKSGRRRLNRYLFSTAAQHNSDCDRRNLKTHFKNREELEKYVDKKEGSGRKRHYGEKSKLNDPDSLPTPNLAEEVEEVLKNGSIQTVRLSVSEVLTKYWIYTTIKSRIIKIFLGQK